MPAEDAVGDGRVCTLKNTLRNGLVIGALEGRYDHMVDMRGESERQIRFEDVVRLGQNHNKTIGNCDYETVEKLVDMLEKYGIIDRRNR